VGQILPPVFAYWRELGSRRAAALCARPDVEERRAAVPMPFEQDLEELAAAAPMMPGAEYLTAEVLRRSGTRSERRSQPSMPNREPRSRNSSSG
jgi:hypothetical protein